MPPLTPLPSLTTAQREAMLLAPYAMHSVHSQGRKYPESSHAYRGPFQRDRDRIVHCAAFRRLSQKTQVFTGHELGDYHRSRLTHSLEVTSIARTIGRALRLNEDLIEALGLQHDLGHPPFGHAGEEALHDCLLAQGGFNHNRQALRIVENLETRYPDFPGLNLSYEVLGGQGDRADKLSRKLFRDEQSLLESQVVDAADSAAYDSHDPDDALQVGVLRFEELQEISLWREAVLRVQAKFTALDPLQLRRATVHELLDWQVSDLITSTTENLRARQIAGVDDVRTAEFALAVPSAEMIALRNELEKFLHGRVYRHPHLLRLRRTGQDKLRTMFAGYVARPALLPENFRSRIEVHGLERTVGDYIAGMTDRFALQEHERLFGGAG